MPNGLPSIESWANSASAGNVNNGSRKKLANIAERVRAAKPFTPGGGPLPGFKFNHAAPAAASPLRRASFTNGGKPVNIGSKQRKSRKSRKSRKTRKTRK